MAVFLLFGWLVWRSVLLVEEIEVDKITTYGSQTLIQVLELNQRLP
jgi:hypothetical protein